MNIPKISSRRGVRANKGFSIIEATVGAGVFGVIFCAFCSGLTSSFSVVGSARETLRATEIMAEKMDTLRLYDWDDITTAGYVPTTFTVPFYPTNGVNAGTSQNEGVTYNGTITFSSPGWTSEDYKSDVKVVTVALTWQRGSITRSASMSTLFSRYGMCINSIF